MKIKIGLFLIGSIFSIKSFAQLDDFYEKGNWQVFFNYSSYAFNDVTGSDQKLTFVKPFFVRISIDRPHKWGGHFIWEPIFTSVLLWGLIWSEESEINDLDLLDQRGMSSGFIGRLSWTKNVVSLDDLIVAAGLEFGDYSVANSSGVVFVGVGPSILVEKTVTNSLALGLSVWSAKSVLQLSQLASSDGFRVSGATARALFKNGLFLEASTMFSKKINNISNTRFDLRFGFALGE